MERDRFIKETTEALQHSPVVTLLGPRQSGKTTLARRVIRSGAFTGLEDLNYFDLEDPSHLQRLASPKLALEHLDGLVVIDEIQRRPDLFPILRVLVDREKNATRFLILGSASRDLIRQGSETLAGRIHFIEVTPFHLQEVGAESSDTLWCRGGFPPSFLAESDKVSWQWRENYIRTFLERDIPLLGLRIPALTLRRFWMMLAHYHGQQFNASEIGKSLGFSDKTVKHYLDILAGTFLIRRLPPWYENLNKRQIKTPKIYFRDSGLFHRLQGIADRASLYTHPKLGASWEGFALEQIIRRSGIPEEELFYWGIHNQAEVDLLLFPAGRRYGMEIKYTDTPRITASQKQALECLRLDSITVIVPGEAFYPLADRIFVQGLNHFIRTGPPKI